jgi:thymidylate synthase
MVPTQLERTPKKTPIVLLNPDVTDIDGFKMGDFSLVDYESHDPIPYKMSA